ncbi:MAG: ribonuclease P protein component [Planctomycetota bacterium]|nr:ribonuclease P protein component [Planctomycetota bacterium]
MTQRFMFARSQRLTRSEDFAQVYSYGTHQADATLVVNVASNNQPFCRMGLSVSRHVGGAVLRNRWKRAIREAFRLNQTELPTGFDIVVRPRRGATFCPKQIDHSLCELVCRAVTELSLHSKTP